jgi:hypothetical protein
MLNVETYPCFVLRHTNDRLVPLRNPAVTHLTDDITIDSIVGAPRVLKDYPRSCFLYF